MNTQLHLLDKQLSLVRYPPQHQHKSLQAWDSADEYMIETVMENHALEQGDPCFIFNDDFGALGCFFAEYSPTWISDSHIAHCSLQTNLKKNGLELNDSKVHIQDCLAPLPPAPKLVLLKVPRTLALLEQQLYALSQVMTPATTIIAGGKVKNITRSVLALFEKYIGTTKTSLAKKKSRLIFPQPEQDKATLEAPKTTDWTMKTSTGQELTITNHANVFSRQSLDIGARILIDHMKIGPYDRIIDLGCGNGVLGLNALAIAPHCKVTFIDESYMAVASAKDNVQRNFPDAIDQCEFVVSNCLDTILERHSSIVYDKILCNPPFHQQNTITDHIAWQMFYDAYEVLADEGELLVVANRHLDYPQKLKKRFGGANIIASHNKFVIYCSTKLR
jgi:23S rRNA (guanine1835-N2)-methyltransferase